MQWLVDGPRQSWPAKAAALARLAQAGLPVPPAIVVPANRPLAPDLHDALQTLMNDGSSVIVRAALSGEDERCQSAAGLGHTKANCRNAAEIAAAIQEIVLQRSDPWVVAYLGPPQATDHIIIQSEVRAKWMVVAAFVGPGRCFVEVHPGNTDALSHGTTPFFSGMLEHLTESWATDLQSRCAAAAEVEGTDPHGLDVELVVDHHDIVHIVQARPIVEPLFPGWAEFAAQLRPEETAALVGTLVLDAEHNPAPLSPAHTWLVRWLAQRRPSARQLRVLAGWLYTQTVPQDPPEPKPSPEASVPIHATLRRLQEELIPAARSRLETLDVSLRGATATETAELMDEAGAAFLTMIDVYAGDLMPVRAKARYLIAACPQAPLSTRHRGPFMDVLPVAWDLAAAPLAEHLPQRTVQSEPAPPVFPQDDAAAATLLREWDDHLFALGLAPLRRVYVRAGELLGLGDDVFLLDGPQVQQGLRSGQVDRALLEHRRAAQVRFAQLQPPLRIEHGQPVPAFVRGHLRGLPIGTDHEGTIAQRRDLAHLLARPPSTDAIVVLPSISAQGAVVLSELGVRAMCCEFGGALSHATLMSRELGLSALIGCQGCIAVPDGARARIETRTGHLRVRPKR